jgi:hypothetical protein
MADDLKKMENEKMKDDLKEEEKWKKTSKNGRRP